jgi:DNA-binding GntR family transcriptional regulator
MTTRGNREKGNTSVISSSFSREVAPFAISHIAAPIREQVEAQLRHAIVTGHFRPGSRLIERDLCTLLGVSRTSLREALRQLEGDGLVINIPHKGMVVAVITKEEAEEIYEVRAVVEGLAGRLCAEHLTNELEHSLQGAMEHIETAYQAKDLAELVGAKEQFYHILLGGCGNRTAGMVLRSLHDRIASLRTLTLAQPGRADASIIEMRQIFHAIVARDGQAASHACINHVEQAQACAVQVLLQRQRSIEHTVVGKEREPR